MKVNVAKVEMELVDKLTGIAYKIEATDKAANGEISKAYATEILAEDDEREPKKVTIDEDNALTFRVTKWVADTDLHDAEIANGILRVDNKDVVMGSIIATRILKIFPGTVVFAAAGENPEDREIVYEYTPSRDRFDKLGTIEQKTELIEETETRDVFGFSFTKEIEIENDGVKEKKTVFDRAGLYVLTKGKLDFTELAGSGESGDRCWDEDNDEDDEEYDECDEYEPDDDFLGFNLADVVIAQGDKYFYIPVIDGKKEVTYKVYRITNAARFAETIQMPGDLTAVTANNAGDREAGRVIYSGEGFVKLDNVVIRSNELSGYIYLVDVRRDKVNDTNTYVLSTEDRKLKKAIRKNTPDRGEIITIE